MVSAAVWLTLAIIAVEGGQWAVKVQPTADPQNVASSQGCLLVGPVSVLPGWYRVECDDVHREWRRSALQDDHILAMEEEIPRMMTAKFLPVDPLFANQWHLQYTGQGGPGITGVDVSVVGAWRRGLSGRGVNISIVDDGLNYSHADLSARYLPSLSLDINGNDTDPMPEYAFQAHGTSCGGVAAAANETTCGVGAAYQANLAGVRLIAAPVTPTQEAEALTYRIEEVSISSNSWGPSDNGGTLHHLPQVVLDAFAYGTTYGRHGLGTIYTWAGGNGRENADWTSFDGYTGNPYVIAVGAVNVEGRQTYYSESGSTLLIVAPSGSVGSYVATSPIGITTTTNGGCTSVFGGTSSATPLVTGIIALMLEENPLLTWRDVRCILARTATMNDPTDPGWKTNHAPGPYNFNSKYGFGMINATAAVHLAATWANVYPMMIETSGTLWENLTLTNGTRSVTATFTWLSHFTSVEYVTVNLNVQHNYRQGLRVVLTSPAGTESVLADHSYSPPRLYDHCCDYYYDPFALPEWEFDRGLINTYGRTKEMTNACALDPSLADKIVLLERSSECSLHTSIELAEESGAVGVIVNLGSLLVWEEIPGTVNHTIPVFGTIEDVWSELWCYEGDEHTMLHEVQQQADYDSFDLGTTHFLGEDPVGTWTLTIEDSIHRFYSNETGIFHAWELSMYAENKGMCANVSCPTGPCLTSSCDLRTGLCDTQVFENGTMCGSALLLEVCDSGACVGICEITSCSSDNPCVPVACNTSTGACESFARPEGTICANSSSDKMICTSGVCEAACNSISCTHLNDACNTASCDSLSGECVRARSSGPICQSSPLKFCVEGVCTGLCENVTCSPRSPCHAAGTCSPQSGLCSNVQRPDGSVCASTPLRLCRAGSCVDMCEGIICSRECHSEDACYGSNGTCSASGAALPDGTRCRNGTMACMAGECADRCAGRTCASSTCQRSTCDPSTGECRSTAARNGSVCAADQESLCVSGACVVYPRGTVEVVLSGSVSNITIAAEVAEFLGLPNGLVLVTASTRGGTTQVTITVLSNADAAGLARAQLLSAALLRGEAVLSAAVVSVQSSGGGGGTTGAGSTSTTSSATTSTATPEAGTNVGAGVAIVLVLTCCFITAGSLGFFLHKKHQKEGDLEQLRQKDKDVEARRQQRQARREHSDVEWDDADDLEEHNSRTADSSVQSGAQSTEESGDAYS